MNRRKTNIPRGPVVMQYIKIIPTVVFTLLLFSSNSFSQIELPASAASAPEGNGTISADAPPPPPVTRSSSSASVVGSTNPASRYVRKDGAARIPRFETPPVIDGDLKDTAWQQAAVFGDFLQVQPSDNAAPSNVTEVVIGYDAKNLYLGFVIKEPRNEVRATVAKRDNIFSDDYVGVYLDTFNDKRQAYCLFFNPLGVQADGVFTETNGEDYSVDIFME